MLKKKSFIEKPDEAGDTAGNAKFIQVNTPAALSYKPDAQFQTGFYPSAPPPWFVSSQAQQASFQLRLFSRLANIDARLNTVQLQLKELVKASLQTRQRIPTQNNPVTAHRNVEAIRHEREAHIAHNRLRGDGTKQPFDIVRFNNLTHPLDYRLPVLLNCAFINNLSQNALKVYLRGYGIAERPSDAEKKRALGVAIGCHEKYPFK